MRALRVVSVNIMWDKHLDTVLPFLVKENSDVVCIQELYDADIPLFQNALGMEYFFVPTIAHENARGRILQGNAIFSRYPLSETKSAQYGGSEGELKTYNSNPEAWGTGLEKGMLVGATVTKENVPFRIFTTHFTWTRKGESNERQKADLARMFGLLGKEKEFVLCGDFNAPRGKETWDTIAEKLKDNIPLSYTTSLDENLHRVGPEKFREEKMDTYVVDGCFTSPGYSASNVRLEFGVSDHAAVIADIEHAT